MDNNISRLIFYHLPTEIQMMIFNHLYPDKQSLAYICLTCHNLSTIAQNSYSWQLLQQGFNTREYGEEFFMNHNLYAEELNDWELLQQELNNRENTEEFTFHSKPRAFEPVSINPLFCVIFNKNVDNQRLFIYFREYFMLVDEKYRQRNCYFLVICCLCWRSIKIS